MGDRGMRSPSAAAQQEAAMASALFDHFCTAPTLKLALGYHRNLCDTLHLKPTRFPDYYPKLKAKLSKSWKAQALFKKFDARASHKCYQRGEATPHTRVLIIGAGPCGLRAAIETQLLGAKVVVVEKRDRMSRNNVLHLWPFVIHDLRALGAKKFFGKFCAGAIDHISIRQLQIILLKVALLLGVEIHEAVAFEKLVEPSDGMGWRCRTNPPDHPVSQYEFDVLIGADGKRNTLEGFKRKEFRGKLAIAITANFINKRSEAEAKVEEISGVAFIFNQKFFKDLYAETGIDLENIVYYKDDTHYFVMTAKKHSLLDKGVIIQDFADTAKLLALENVDRAALMKYAREAAEFSTEYQMPGMEFAVNHYGKPDVAMFDFTSMYAAENASRVLHKSGYKLLMCLVGDSLLEPFWPTGSGCARGFLSAMDACWAIKGWGGCESILDVVAQRESVYRLLGHSTPENLQRDCSSYTLDPSTRYQNLNKSSVLPQQVKSLITTDDPSIMEIKSKSADTNIADVPRKRRRRDSKVLPETLVHWINFQIAPYNLQIDNLMQLLDNGLVLCAVLHRYRPDLIHYTECITNSSRDNNCYAVNIMERELGIPSTLFKNNDDYTSEADLIYYITQIYYTFRGEIPYIKHPKLEMPDKKADVNPTSAFAKMAKFGNEAKADNGQLTSSVHTYKRRSRTSNDGALLGEKVRLDAMKKLKKRRSDRFGGLSVDRERGLGLPGGTRRPLDEDFSNRIKNYEQQLKFVNTTDKKPKDLLRAIGKIESSDWNVKEIEKKIQESKKATVSSTHREKVPKWSREQFLARQNKMESKGTGLERQDSNGEKFKEIDHKLKEIDKQLKEPALVALTKYEARKVANLAGNFTNDKLDDKQRHIIEKPLSTNTKLQSVLANQKNSDLCHFCGKRVYLMERLCAEGLTFHRACLRCTHCGTHLRVGACSFDRDGKVYCTQHLGMPGKETIKKSKDLSPIRKDRTPDKIQGFISGLDLIDRGQTPERIEYEIDRPPVETEDDHSLSPMDEDEWTDRNFGASTVENLSSDFNESDVSSESSESEDEYSEAFDNLDNMQIANRKYRNNDDVLYEESPSDEFYHEYSDEDSDDNDTHTDGEQDAAARELRRMEIPLNYHPPKNAYSNTEASTEDSTSSSNANKDIQNSATEISTDSEFEHDGLSKIREVPSIMIDDTHVTKTRGSSFYQSLKMQVKTTETRRMNGQRENLLLAKTKPKNKVTTEDGVELDIRPIVEFDKEIISKISSSKENSRATPFVNPNPGDYLLKHTQSTSGIASKTSLELKKRYLLGNDNLGSGLMKSGSASALDSKFKSFHNNISEYQKLLHPAPDLNSQKLINAVQPSQFPSSFNTTSHTHSSENIISDENNFKLNIIKVNNSQKLGKPDFSSSNADEVKNYKNLIENAEDLTEIKDSILNSEQLTNNNSRDITPTNEMPNFAISKQYYNSENDYRCRSPAHETSIIVPEISWITKDKEDKAGTDLETDSLSMTSESSTENLIDNQYNQLISRSPSLEISGSNKFVPQIEVTGIGGELMQIDSLMVNDSDGNDEGTENKIDEYVSVEDKNINEVNQVHPFTQKPSHYGQQSFETSDNNMINKFTEPNKQKPLTDFGSESKIITAAKVVNSEYCSDSDSANEITTALTETELSDWAVDDAVSENIVDVEYSINSEFLNSLKHKKSKMFKNAGKWRKDSTVLIAKVEDFDDLGISHVCGKRIDNNVEQSSVASLNNRQNLDIENIEFMDSASDGSCIENAVAATDTPIMQNKGYVQFVDNDFVTKSDLSQNTSTIAISEVMHPINLAVIDNSRKDVDYIEQGACVLGNDIKENMESCNEGGMVKNSLYCDKELPKLISSIEKSVIDDKLDENKIDRSFNNSDYEKYENLDHDDDSLVLVESAADTTTSDLLTIMTTPMETPSNPDKTWTNEICNTININDGAFCNPITNLIDNSDQMKTLDDKYDANWRSQENSKAYHDYIQTVKDRTAGFGNLRDSIDVRKSRRQSKSNINIIDNAPKQISSDCNQASIANSKNMTQEKANGKIENNYNSPTTLKKLEEITKERVKQKDLIHNLVMDKLQNKKMLNAEKRLNRCRTRSSFSPSSGIMKSDAIVSTTLKKYADDVESKCKTDKGNSYDKSLSINQMSSSYNLQKSPTDSAIMKPLNADSMLYQLSNVNSPIKHHCELHHSYSSCADPNCQNSHKMESTPLTSFKKLSQHKSIRPLSVHSSFKIKTSTRNAPSASLPDTPLTNPEAFSVPDLTKKINEELFCTPVAPPRLKRDDDLRKTTEKLRQDAKLRAHIKSNEDLGLSPEDKYLILKQKINKKSVGDDHNEYKGQESLTEQSFDGDLRSRIKMVQDTNRPSSTSTIYSSISHDSAKDKSVDSSPKTSGFYTSDPNVSSASHKTDIEKKTKVKDRERRKSIIQAVSDFFHKKISHSNPSSPIKEGKLRGIYSSQKSKDISKSCFDMDHLNSFDSCTKDEALSNRCQSEKNLNTSRIIQDEQPPPIPPPPLNYIPPNLGHISDGSQSEDLDGRGLSLEALDCTNSSYNADGANPSSSEPKRRRSQRAVRKAELKRFRKAQENQRQREETEVKQRELEAKGVAIEKALRGEDTENTQLDEHLFASWMQLRKEQQKLHVYDQMLSIQARELQLEDRHARLQNELRERLLQDDSGKTDDDANRESQILQEMLEIVKMHDSLLLERDRLRNAGTPTSDPEEITRVTR